MSDIFISYANEDRSRAERLAQAFEARGWSVWWDPAGQKPSEIRQAHRDAKCQVLLFSELSARSESWAMSLVMEARKHSVVLFPVLLDEVEVPLEFRRLQTVSLVGWQGGEPHAGFDRLLAAIERVLGAPRGEKGPEKPGRHSTTVQAEAQAGEERGRGPHWRTWIRRGVRVVVLVAGLGFLLLGAWALARWGLKELNASATVTRDSSVCRAVPGFGPEMILVEGGPFQRGAEAGSVTSAKESVDTVKPFAIGTCEVTFEEYDRFAEATKRSLPDDEGWGRGRRPVINVSWDDAKAYAAWVSQQTGKSYRLPTEAEWEYAARSGGKPEIWAGTSDEKQLPNYAVYNTNRTEPVGGKKPNGLGLYDMSGNVREWLQDCFDKAGDEKCRARVIRGGSWVNVPGVLRASYRFGLQADYRNFDIGFRLVQDMSE